MNPDSLKDQRVLAHEFTRQLIPIVLESTITSVLDSAFSVIGQQREAIEKQTRDSIAPDSTEEFKQDLVQKSFNQFLQFQSQIIQVSIENISTITWGVVGRLTSDYFPDLLSEEKKRQEAEKNGNTPADSETVLPRITVHQGDTEVDSGETVRAT
jgi:hypothetical protein